VKQRQHLSQSANKIVPRDRDVFIPTLYVVKRAKLVFYSVYITIFIHFAVMK